MNINIFNILSLTIMWKPSTATIFSSILGISIGYAAYRFIKKRPYILAVRENPKPKEPTPEEQYISKNKKAFITAYNRSDPVSRSNSNKMNDNIELSFYHPKSYSDAIASAENPLEAAWKRRILYEFTPRGNIVMHYDAYRHAFAYYADVSIPYSILNAAAMKYVRTFLCRDFFIDESEIPIGFSSPFMRTHNIDGGNSAQKEPKIDITKGPFAKLKQYSSNNEKPNSRKTGPSTDTSSVAQNTKHTTKNKFILLGKLYNFQILNRSGIATANMSKQVAVNKSLNYSDFKSWRNPVATKTPAGETDSVNIFEAHSA
jgi:hypothetical protein